MDPNISNKLPILDELFSGNKQLPTVPEVYTKFTRLIRDPLVSNKNIANLIKKDQSMVAKILKLCNSAIYCRRQEINNLSGAITFLGFEAMQNLILQITLARVFHFDDELIPEFKITTFWEHSLSTAYFAEFIADQLKLPLDENYYIGGLLHDIGKLLIYQFYPEKFKEIILELIRSSGKVLDYESETEILGVDHTDIGFYFAEKWNFKKDIVEAIASHHDSHTYLGLHVAVVRLANMFSKAVGLCFPWDHQFFEIVCDPTWEVFSNYIQGDVNIEQMIKKIVNESDKIKASVKDLLEVERG
jgi:putative nucleotidyltransferase with HDIG domain